MEFSSIQIVQSSIWFVCELAGDCSAIFVLY